MLEGAALVHKDARPLEGGTVMISPTMQTWHQAVVDPLVHTRCAGHTLCGANTHLIYQTVPTS